MDRGAWQAIGHGVTELDTTERLTAITQLSRTSNSMFSFIRNLHTVLTVGVPLYIPTNSLRFTFLHTLSSINYADFLMMAILAGVM